MSMQLSNLILYLIFCSTAHSIRLGCGVHMNENGTTMLSWRRTVAPCGGVVIFLLVSVTAVTSQTEENSLVCNPDSNATLKPDGSIHYGDLPPIDSTKTREYSPQGLEGWYYLARKLVDAVQPKNLPYDVIERTIRDNDLGCSIVRGDNNCSSVDVDVQATLSLGRWWAPLIGVTVFGSLLATLFGFVGAIFWCCRCCGNCGGGYNKKDPQDKWMFGLTITLMLIVAVLFVGVVLSFYSNEQSFDSIESLQQTMNNIVDKAVIYMNGFLNQGDALMCQFIQVTDIALMETDRLNSSLNELIEDASSTVKSALKTLDELSTGIHQTSDILSNVSTATQQMKTDGNTLNANLNAIVILIGALNHSCYIFLSASQCDAGVPPVDIFTIKADYNNLPDVSQELNDVQNSLQNIDFQNSINQGNAEFERLTNETRSSISEHLGQGSLNSSGMLQSLTAVNTTLFNTRDSVVRDVREVINNTYNPEDCPTVKEIFNGSASNITLTVGFIRQCYINQFFKYIQEYDQIWYGFGIVVCCLALITVVLTLVGVILGVVGWRKDRSPDSRTKISHCGGIMLLIDVGLTFLFGFLLLLLACLAFFFGSNMQKICQAIEPPQYELFSRVVDNQELWGGSVLGQAVFKDKQQTFSLSAALKSCEANEALYTAFNLSVLFDVRSQILNTTQIFDDLRSQVNNTVDSFNYTADSFLDNQTRTALDAFASANVEKINITAYRETLSEDAVGFNITETIMNLQQLSAAAPLLTTDVNTIVFQLKHIRDSRIPTINANVAQLEKEVDQLANHTDGVVLKTLAVEKQISSLVTNLTGGMIREIAIKALNSLEGYIDSFINHTITSIEGNVGQCKPLSNIYSSAYSTVCNEAVDGLNGYWWSLGFCCLCFIPLIIFAVLTSTHYLRQKPWYDWYDDGSFPDFLMKEM